METAPLKAFATKARTELIKAVGGRIAVVLAENSLARLESARAVRALEEAIARHNLESVTDRVAYTWFNRIIAMRFMDANGYTRSGVVSSAAGQSTGQPEVLAEAKAGVFDDAIVPKRTQDTITALFNGNRASQDRDGEAYGLLLEAYCRSWNKAMPFMFEREGDYTELLIPTALLAADSVRDRAVRTLTEEVCREVEVIGWLYQFYISDRKDEVFEGFKKNKKAGAAEIPAATQLFTPHWIVRYLVENSLGRLWLLNNPSSRLGEQMDYYVKPAEAETEYLKIEKPEELKIIDPAVGSGHMLTYAFDLLYAIYSERGYDPAEIPGLILEHNLYGTEIDPRAGALAAFALTMKAASKRKLFLKNPVHPHIRVLHNVHFDPAELDYLWSLTKADGFTRADSDEFWSAFEHADTFGSLIQPEEHFIAPLKAVIEGMSAAGDLLYEMTLEKAGNVLGQATLLTQGYPVVIANPPYMGASSFSPLLEGFIQENYSAARADLFAAFILLGARLARRKGTMAMIAKQNWLFRPAFSELRSELLTKFELEQVAHFGAGAFDSLPGEIASTAAFILNFSSPGDRLSWFARITEGDTEVKKNQELLEAVRRGVRVYKRKHSDFLRIPGTPVCYWMSELMLNALANGPYMGDALTAREGMATGNNALYLRFWWEVAIGNIARDISTRQQALATKKRWFPYNKGGGSRRWYGFDDYVVDWYQDGRELQSRLHPSGKRIWAHNFNLDFIFRESVSWSSVTSRGIALRYYPEGFLFDAAGLSAFSRGDRGALYKALALGNSEAGSEIADLLNPTHHFKAGDFSRLPLPDVDSAKLSHLVERAIEITRRDWNTRETAPGFTEMNGIKRHGMIEQWASDYLAKGERETTELLEVESSLQTLVSEGLRSEDSHALSREAITLHGNVHYMHPAVNDQRGAALRSLVAELVSYSIGCMFGRYSLDKPGLILADQSSSLEDYLAQIESPSFFPDRDNVIPIVDGDWFEDDIVARFRQFLRAAFGDEHFEENLRFITESLGVKDIRDYFVKSFYDEHVKRYKKRPIYWLFRSPKGSFSALIYLHRYSASTVSTVLTGYLREFIGKLEANLEHQGRVASGMGGVSARDVANAQKEADRIRKVLVELRDYEHDILFPLAGQQIKLDLDDGVQISYQKLGAALKDIGLKKDNNSD